MDNPEDPKHVRNHYNAVSGTYDRRYEINPLNGVAGALRGDVPSWTTILFSAAAHLNSWA